MSMKTDNQAPSAFGGHFRYTCLFLTCNVFSYLCALWSYLWVACAFGMSLGSYEWLRPFCQWGVLGWLIGIALLIPFLFKPATYAHSILCLPALLCNAYFCRIFILACLND